MTGEGVAGRAVIETPSPNRDERPSGCGPVDTLVIHYTGMVSAAAALARLTDARARVSAHWCVGEDGTLWRLVPEEQRAWHAGISAWRGRRSVNDRSIGIELVNPGHEHGYRPFPPAQMDALVDLARAIAARHPIDPRNVVAHADIAPGRRQDPGELFDWARLARAGIGLWPDEGAAPAPAPAPAGTAPGRPGRRRAAAAAAPPCRGLRPRARRRLRRGHGGGRARLSTALPPVPRGRRDRSRHGRHPRPRGHARRRTIRPGTVCLRQSETVLTGRARRRSQAGPDGRMAAVAARCARRRKVRAPRKHGAG